jgi:hypothetical protein
LSLSWASSLSLSWASSWAWAFASAIHFSDGELLSDTITYGESEDSWTGERKNEDYWGYTWPHTLRVNELRHTTGRKASDGGWFDAIDVQVRRGRAWVSVTGLTVTPDYPNDSSVPNNFTYALRFDDAITDGVRLYGRPGGNSYFTSISELMALYE